VYGLLRRTHSLTTAIRLYGALWSVWFEGTDSIRRQVGASTWRRLLLALEEAGVGLDSLLVQLPDGKKGKLAEKVLRYGTKAMPLKPGFMDDF